MPSFSIGGATREGIEVTVDGYERSPAGEYYDDNWLRVRICVSVGAFSGEYAATFLTDELASFKVQLEKLYQSLKGTASFTTMEEQLSLQISGNGKGAIQAQGDAVDDSGNRNKLYFAFHIDQTYLQSTLQELQGVTELFPVRSSQQRA
jgi:hypothetical protein